MEDFCRKMVDFTCKKSLTSQQELPNFPAKNGQKVRKNIPTYPCKVTARYGSKQKQCGGKIEKVARKKWCKKVCRNWKVDVQKKVQRKYNTSPRGIGY